jgi:hypothetical protein
MSMRSPNCLLVLVAAATLLSGCCQLIPSWPGCTSSGVKFSVTVTNGATVCADINGEFDLKFRVTYVQANSGAVITRSGDAMLGETNTLENVDAADNDGDERIDQLTVSINMTCSPQNPSFQDYILDGQVPVNGGVTFTADANDVITFQITQPPSVGASVTSGAKKALGLENRGNQTSSQRNEPGKSCCGEKYGCGSLGVKEISIVLTPALLRPHSPATSAQTASSTAALSGSSATPTAMRVCLPLSPNASTNRSDAPLTTCGCLVKPSADCT